MRVAVKIVLSEEERATLEEWVGGSPVRLRERARIVLMAAEGATNKEIAARLGTNTAMVARWRNRFAEEGVSGIEKGRPRGGNHGGKDSAEQARLRLRVIEATTRETPEGAARWSCRSLARHFGTTHGFVHRVWRAHGLTPR